MAGIGFDFLSIYSLNAIVSTFLLNEPLTIIWSDHIPVEFILRMEVANSGSDGSSPSTGAKSECCSDYKL